MRRLLIHVVLATVVAGLPGCGDSAATSETTTSPGASGRAAQAAGEATPAAAVEAFLAAIRAGNEQGARDLLTKVAQQRTAEMEIEIAPPWEESATFSVGETEIQPNGIAHVGCTLSDGEETINIVWALRPEEGGWRVAGLATKVHPDQESPLVLNYEDPEEMLRQFAELESGELEEPAEGTAPDEEHRTAEVEGVLPRR